MKKSSKERKCKISSLCRESRCMKTRGEVKIKLDPVLNRKKFHYDNCAMAMITLFAVQTSEGWIA